MNVRRCIKNKNAICYYTLFRIQNYSLTVVGAKSGSDNFLQDFEKCHLETTELQKTLLSIGSAITSLADPRRGDMIATLGETTGKSSLEVVRSEMLKSAEGSRILNDKPRISSSTVDLNKLRNLKDGTVGKAYYEFLSRYGYTPDARLAVRFVDDVELAYVIQRYREVHDLFHTILAQPTNMLGEVTVKWVEGIQTRLPMCIGGAIFGAARLAPKFSRSYSTLRRPKVELDIEHSADRMGRIPLKTNLGCVSVPSKIQDVIEVILQERNLADLEEGGKRVSQIVDSRKPPLEPYDVRQKRKEVLKEMKQRYPFEGNEDSQEERQFHEAKLESLTTKTVSTRLHYWKPLPMDEKSSYYYLYGRTAAEYAVLRRVFNEIVVRDKEFAPRTLFDFGSGVGTVTWLSHELWGKSITEYFTVDISPDMCHLARLILQGNDDSREPFLKTLFQRQFLPATARPYDLVVSAYSLMEIDSLQNRVNTLKNLWAKTSNYLVIVEKGSNAGFQLVEEARALCLQIAEESKDECHVFAPCPHEKPCPRLRDDSRTPCNFFVKYYPLKMAAKNQEPCRELFSYVILKKGKRPEITNNWPRLVREVLLRHKHVICRLCAPSGQLNEVILTASKHGKELYKCGKKCSWGDTLPVSLQYEQSESVAEESTKPGN